MEKWYVAAKKADFDKWAADLKVTPVMARILRNRDLVEEEQARLFLYGTLKDCHSPWLMKDMDRAVEHLVSAMEAHLKLRVIGDYDVDGICSSFILTKGLQILGGDVDTVIPHRIHDGYGLSDELIQAAAADGVNMIITCDNGIAAAKQITLANELGMQVIVTDHHEVPYAEKEGVRTQVLPPALCVVDPKREDCGYPFEGICGGVVVYKLMQALAERTKHKGLEHAMEEFLEFAALATVCDVMELKDENRILVREGLRRMRQSQNEGLRALIEVNELDANKLSAYHLGFVLGPCLNASGRLDTAKRGLELLESLTKVDAMRGARELKELNDSRKNLTLQGVEKAKDYLREQQMEQDKVLVIYLPEVHESLAGIIAGRIREEYNRPVFVLTKGEEGVKGSGRSMESYHMYDEMTKVKQFFTKYGGHKLAAGLSMREEDIAPLKDALNQNCELTEEDFLPKVHIDVPMPLGYATEDLAKEMELLEPFGVGNPKPLFAQKDLIFTSGSKMGKNKNFARFTVRTPEGSKEQLLFFGSLEQFGGFLKEKYGEESEEKLYRGEGDFKVSVVYQLGWNTFRGKGEKQFIMQYYC